MRRCLPIGWGESSLGEVAEGPGVFCGQLVHDVPVLERGRQDLPGVGFHLEVVAEGGVGRQLVEDAEDVVGGGFEAGGWGGVEGDVEMDAPFAGAGRSARGGVVEGIFEVAEAVEIALGGPDDHLMEVDGVGEGLEGGEGFRGWGEAEGVAEVEFADFDAGGAEAAQGGGGVLELDGEVAAIVIDAQEGIEAVVAGPVLAQLFEEAEGFLGGFKVAEGLGFEAEVEEATGGGADAFDVLEATPEVGAGDP